MREALRVAHPPTCTTEWWVRWALHKGGLTNQDLDFKSRYVKPSTFKILNRIYLYLPLKLDKHSRLSIVGYRHLDNNNLKKKKHETWDTEEERCKKNRNISDIYMRYIGNQFLWHYYHARWQVNYIAENSAPKDSETPTPYSIKSD